MSQKNIKLIISYDGSHYLGWQATKEGPSIELTLLNCLKKILQQPIHLQAASRTDSGVHAKGQVVNFLADISRYTLCQLQLSLNQLLPDDIRVLTIEDVRLDFHPTLDSVEKEYEYKVNTSVYLCPFKRTTYWHLPLKLDIELMQQACDLLIGEKDFKGFTNTKKNPHTSTIRKVNFLRITHIDDDIIFLIRGNHFLYKMIRNIVGTLCYIGSNKLPLNILSEILENKQRAQGGVTAPAHGLTLNKIIY